MTQAEKAGGPAAISCFSEVLRLATPVRGRCLAWLPEAYYNAIMKSMTLRLPEALAADIEDEARLRGISKSDVVRERLQAAKGSNKGAAAIADLIGSVDGLPADLSARKKWHLKNSGYGKKRAR